MGTSSETVLPTSQLSPTKDIENTNWVFSYGNLDAPTGLDFPSFSQLDGSKRNVEDPANDDEVSSNRNKEEYYDMINTPIMDDMINTPVMDDMIDTQEMADMLNGPTQVIEDVLNAPTQVIDDIIGNTVTGNMVENLNMEDKITSAFNEDSNTTTLENITSSSFR